MEITVEDIRAAAERIRPIAHRTPVLTSRTFDGLTGVTAYFKCENFQRGGAFKIRGAANFVYSIPAFERERGVVAYSSGNHAQAVAIAAFSVGIPATLVMPLDAPRSKMEATRGYGAAIVNYEKYATRPAVTAPTKPAKKDAKLKAKAVPKAAARHHAEAHPVAVGHPPVKQTPVTPAALKTKAKTAPVASAEVNGSM